LPLVTLAQVPVDPVPDVRLDEQRVDEQPDGPEPPPVNYMFRLWVVVWSCWRTAARTTAARR
jgi:hypothetical protein